MIDNGYHSESDEQFDSGLDPKLIARGVVGHRNEVTRNQNSGLFQNKFL